MGNGNLFAVASIVLAGLALPGTATAFASSSTQPLLMRTPAVGPDSIVFSFAGDLWRIPREGGAAVRLTVSPGTEIAPHFSPDGKWIAFTGEYAGNADVYVMPATGGTPKRLTFHPGPDGVAGWSADGKEVLFTTQMASPFVPQLASVSAEGGMPKMLPLPSGSAGSYSPNGDRIAYMPGFQFQEAWKRYRGGQTFAIWLANMSDSKVREIPRRNSNDKNPMWVDNSVYFLSDRNGVFGLYRYDVSSNRVAEVVKGEGMDFKSATAGFGAIVLEKLGKLQLLDLKTNRLADVPVTLDGDFPAIRSQLKSGGLAIASISPSGARVAVETRGRIVTVPASKGDARDVTPDQGVANRFPSWSPDGKTLAYLSDKGGEYQLVLRDAQADVGSSDAERRVPLGDAPAYYYKLTWSPDSKKIAYWDNRHNLWVMDVAAGTNEKVDTATYEDPTRDGTPSWSPDSKWLVWHRDLDTQFNAVFAYDFTAKKKHQLTDGLSDAKYPAFDLGGEYLYFVASVDTAASTAWLDLSTYGFNNKTSSVYAAVLKRDKPSPLAPESDEEGGAPKAPAQGKPDDFRIDLDGLDQRFVRLPIPARNYVDLKAASPGTFFVAQASLTPTTPTPGPTSLHKFDLASKAFTTFSPAIQGYDLTAKGDKILIVGPAGAQIVPTATPPQPGQGAVALSGLQVRVDPRAEWRQMFEEVLRIQRDFFYDPNFHGVDLKKLRQTYLPYLDGLRSRADLNYLFEDMLGELCVGHMYIAGGDLPGVSGPGGGLLGADYALEQGRYRLAKVYNGESWNPNFGAPLTQPGVAAKAGEFILAIDGKDLTAKDDIYEVLEGKAGKQVRIKLGPNADGSDSREVTVVPTGSENQLRYLAWREDNRRAVERLSGGRVGYVHVPDTNIGGWNGFNRFYYSQKDRDALVIDERFNGGGSVDDYMVTQMIRPLRSMWMTRYGKDFPSPASQHFGPKVMLINQYAGSGGDYFPWHFRQEKVGPIVGKRTWGGLVGILGFPPLVDGGFVTAPNLAFYNPDGQFQIENYGVDPDFDVEIDPFLWRQGRDPQLEKAVELALERLKTFKKPQIKRPSYQDKTKVGN